MNEKLVRNRAKPEQTQLVYTNATQTQSSSKGEARTKFFQNLAGRLKAIRKNA